MGPEVRDQVLEMCRLAHDDQGALHAKTGWDHQDDQPDHGWFAGVLVTPGGRVVFAVLLRSADPVDVATWAPARRATAERLLRAMGHHVPAPPAG